MPKNVFRKLSITVLGRKSLRNNGFKEWQIINLSGSPTYLGPAMSAVGQTGPGTILELSAAGKVAEAVAYPGIVFRGGGGSTNSVEDREQRERGSGGGGPLVRGSGGSYNLVQENSIHILTFS